MINPYTGPRRIFVAPLKLFKCRSPVLTPLLCAQTTYSINSFPSLLFSYVVSNLSSIWIKNPNIDCFIRFCEFQHNLKPRTSLAFFFSVKFGPMSLLYHYVHRITSKLRDLSTFSTSWTHSVSFQTLPAISDQKQLFWHAGSYVGKILFSYKSFDTQKFKQNE